MSILRKHPIGSWQIYCDLLPSKNKENIINKVLRLINGRSLIKFKGKCLKIDMTKRQIWMKSDRKGEKIYIEELNEGENIIIEHAFNRNLKDLGLYKSRKKEVEDFINEYEKEIRKVCNIIESRNYTLELYKKKNEAIQLKDFEFHYCFDSDYIYEKKKPILKMEDFEVNYFYDNHYIFKGKEFSFVYFMKPNNCKIYNTLIADFEDEDDYKLLLVDPPWKYMGSNPNRGPHIKYKTDNTKKIFKDLERFMKKTEILAIWVVNYFYVEVLEWIEEMNFEIIELNEQIKFTNLNKLHHSLGFYLQHCKDTLIIAKRKDLDRISDKNYDDVLFRKRSIPSAKSKDISLLLKKKFDLKDFEMIELYSRNNNLSSGWKHVGNEVDEDGLRYLLLNQKEMPKKFVTNK